MVVHTRLAMAIAAILAAAPMHARGAESAAAGELEEIQVTATRHSESISDVPYNISAVSGTDIAAAGVIDLQGLTHMIPGLVSPDLGARGSSINSNLTSPGVFAEQRGIDCANTWYARGALLWKPGDALKFTLTYQHQTDQSGGYSQSRPGPGYRDQRLFRSRLELHVHVV